jgi:hypothetical protein
VSALLQIAERLDRGEHVSPDEYPDMPTATPGDGSPIDHPIEMLPVIARMVDVGVKAAGDMYAKLSRARSRPHMLDDATVAGVERSAREELDGIGHYEWQLGRWQERALTAEQASEIRRLQTELAPSRAIVQMTLELCAELRRGTINAIMRKDDAELGLEFLLGLRPLPWASGTDRDSRQIARLWRCGLIRPSSRVGFRPQARNGD